MMDLKRIKDHIAAEFLNAAGKVWEKEIAIYRQIPWWHPIRKHRQKILARRFEIAFEMMIEMYAELTSAKGS